MFNLKNKDLKNSEITDLIVSKVKSKGFRAYSHIAGSSSSYVYVLNVNKGVDFWQSMVRVANHPSNYGGLTILTRYKSPLTDSQIEAETNRALEFIIKECS